MNKLTVLCALIFLVAIASCKNDKNAHDWQCDQYQSIHSPVSNGHSTSTFTLYDLTETEMKEMIADKKYNTYDLPPYHDTLITNCH